LSNNAVLYRKLLFIDKNKLDNDLTGKFLHVQLLKDKLNLKKVTSQAILGSLFCGNYA
jgi:hypothetical protein